jgi:hypothetical protein
VRIAGLRLAWFVSPFHDVTASTSLIPGERSETRNPGDWARVNAWFPDNAYGVSGMRARW